MPPTNRIIEVGYKEFKRIQKILVMKKYKHIINMSVCLAIFLFTNVEEIYAQSSNVESSLIYKSEQADSLFATWAQNNSPGIAVLVC